MRNLHICLAFTTLLTLGLAVGCTGFFVNPQLTSMTVSPQTVTITKGQTQPMTATGTYDDGSTKNLTGRAIWSSSNTSCATVNGTGVVTGLSTVTSTCTTTITAAATSAAVTATASVTVTPGTLQSIALTASPTTAIAGSTVTFTAMATYSGSTQQQDITTQVTWTVSNTTVLTINQGSGSGTISSSAISGSTASVTASLSGVTSNSVTITVQ